MSASDSTLNLNIECLMSAAIGPEHGLTQAELDALAERIEDATTRIAARRGRDIGFMELPYDTQLAQTVRHKADELRSWCLNFVVLGIGGSALGNKTLHAALQHPFHDMLTAARRRKAGAPRIIVLDNIDPDLMSAALDLLKGELRDTVFNVITKSGTTAETMSQFLMVRELLRRRKGCDPTRQIIVTTEPRPDKSLLCRIAQQEGYAMLPVPPNVGGRFSILSAVGLLSAAVDGVDIKTLLAGAAAMDRRCRSPKLPENPAALYAAALYLLHTRKGKPITVLMPYCHALRALADWYCQLWAESLGKRDGLSARNIFSGPTPIASVGVTDQHSMMQLYQDGPFDKVITFIEVAQPAKKQRICKGEVEPELSYLAGRTFQDLLSAELAATRCALRDKQRPNCTIRIPRVDAATMGELLMFFEYAVTYAGMLYDVNAFDQPGVELGKLYTYGLMGRKGYEPPRL
jgi:glucose-6-phosphate isomerase